MTVSRDLSPAPTPHETDPTIDRTTEPDGAPGAPTPRTPQEPAAVVVPAQLSSTQLQLSSTQQPPSWLLPSGADRLRRAVEALRRATRDGMVHHHRHPGVPRNRRAPGIEVVRVWAEGRDLDEQRRACRTCTPGAAR